MRYIIVFMVLTFGFSGDAMAKKFKIKTPSATGVVVDDTTCTPPCTGVINKTTITNPNGIGLAVSGSPAKKVINKGTISGSTVGLAVSGTSSSVIVNSGVIRGTSVGISQIP